MIGQRIELEIREKEWEKVITRSSNMNKKRTVK
jgi:hypothetical protein